MANIRETPLRRLINDSQVVNGRFSLFQRYHFNDDIGIDFTKSPVYILCVYIIFFIFLSTNLVSGVLKFNFIKVSIDFSNKYNNNLINRK